jgi:hypothetical protein
MEYDISPGVVFPEAEAPLATEEDIERTKSFFANMPSLSLKFVNVRRSK